MVFFFNISVSWFFFLFVFHYISFSSALLMGRSFVPVNFLFSQDIVKAHFLQTGGTVGNVVLSQSDTQSQSAGVCRPDVSVFFPTGRNKTPFDCFAPSFRRQSVLMLVLLAPLKRGDPADPPPSLPPSPTTTSHDSRIVLY